MAKPIKIKIAGDASGFNKVMDGVTSKLGKVGGKLAGAGKKIGVGLGAAAGGAAALGAASVSAAIDFEKSMGEVFTLMPGISGGAMDEMAAQVGKFSKEFGVLPEEVVPALYSALSAGVPADNVFEYMETATKLATGGVTDLDTAVDGLSSVVNAYGSEIITSAEASDIMFTAVRFGKTTVDELATNISKVTPIASALGVGFDEVGASLAVLTASGVPTAEAATQMKGAMAELGKAGSVADKAFKAVNRGGSFTDFIADGGSLVEALVKMKVGGEITDKSVIDMFGSIEAGSAVLSLTKNGGLAMVEVMDEMNDSAGATDKAFDVMSETTGFKINQLKATFKVLAIQIGTKLLPIVLKLVDYVQKKLIPALSKAWAFIKKKVIPVIKQLWKEHLEPLYKKVLKKVVDGFDKLTKGGKDMRPIMAAVAAVAGLAAIALGAFALSMIAAAAPVILVVAGVAALAAGVMYAWNNFEGFRTVVQNVIAWFMNDALPKLKEFGAQLVVLFMAAFEAAKAVVETVLKVILKIWDGWGKDAIEMVQSVFDRVVAVFKNLFNVALGWFELIKSVLTGNWSETWEAIKKIVSNSIAGLLNILSGLWELIEGALSLVRTVIAAAFTLAWNAAKTAVSAGWEEVKKVFNKVATWITNLGSSFWNAGKSIGGKVISGIKSGLSAAGGMVGDLFTGLKNKLVDAVNWAIGKMNDAIPDKLSMGFLGSINLPNNPIPTVSRAMGGPASGSVLVGERGPEVVQLPQGSNVLANHELGGGSGGVVVNVQSNADPFEIASQVAWSLRMRGV